MQYDDLEVFYKFCVNRINYDIFEDIMMDIYPGSERYIEDKWPTFRNSPVMFIVSRGEKRLFDTIMKMIEDADYKG